MMRISVRQPYNNHAGCGTASWIAASTRAAAYGSSSPGNGTRSPLRQCELRPQGNERRSEGAAHPGEHAREMTCSQIAAAISAFAITPDD
jgi:hypothetical protein